MDKKYGFSYINRIKIVISDFLLEHNNQILLLDIVLNQHAQL